MHSARTAESCEVQESSLYSSQVDFKISNTTPRPFLPAQVPNLLCFCLVWIFSHCAASLTRSSMTRAAEQVFPTDELAFVKHLQPQNHRPRAWTQLYQTCCGFVSLISTVYPLPPLQGLHYFSSPTAGCENDTWELLKALLHRTMAPAAWLQQTLAPTASAGKRGGVAGCATVLNSWCNHRSTGVLERWKYVGHPNQRLAQMLNSSGKMPSVNRSTGERRCVHTWSKAKQWVNGV